MTLEERLLVFGTNPRLGAEYFGDAAHACVILGQADEAGARAMLAVTFAGYVLSAGAPKETEGGQ